MHARCSTTKSYNSYVHHMPPPPTLEITDVPRPSRPGWLSIGPWVLPSRMFFDTFGHRGTGGPRLGLGSSTLSRGLVSPDD